MDYCACSQDACWVVFIIHFWVIMVCVNRLVLEQIIVAWIMPGNARYFCHLCNHAISQSSMTLKLSAGHQLNWKKSNKMEKYQNLHLVTSIFP